MKIMESKIMSRDEFIEWLRANTYFERYSVATDSEWRSLIDYADYIWDDLTVDDEKVIFGWDYRYYGGSEYKTREFTFDEFVEAYTNDSIK